MTQADPPTVAIIGAGITGLTAAYELAKRGFGVEIFEAQGAVGGELAVIEIGGTPVERYYHHLFRGDSHMIGLMEELGIDSSLEWLTPQMGSTRTAPSIHSPRPSICSGSSRCP